MKDVKDSMHHAYTTVPANVWGTPSLRGRNPEVMRLRGTGGILSAPFVFPDDAPNDFDQAFKRPALPLVRCPYSVFSV